MEKSKLLEEFVHLKRILKDHETKQGTLNNLNISDTKYFDNRRSRDNSKNTIFLNPNKLNPVHKKNTQKGPCQVSNNEATKSVTKVFINPYFRRPDSSSSVQEQINPPLIRDEKHKPINDHLDKCEISVRHYGQDGVKILSKGPHSYQQQKISQNYGCGLSSLAHREKTTVISNSHVIFVNPDFSSSTKHNVRCVTSSSKHLRLQNSYDVPEHCNQNVSSESKASSASKASSESKATWENKIIKQNLPINLYSKRKVFMNGSKIPESFTSDQKRRKAEDSVTAVRKIFLNPEFEGSELQGCESSNTGDKTLHMKENGKITPSPSCGTQTLVMSSTSTIPVILDQKEVTKKFTTLSYPLCAIVGPDCGKQIFKKTTNQRIRTRSTSLITISTTKLVRKRKLSQKATETNLKVPSQPVFVSKTKLVRNVCKRTLNSSSTARLKIKQLNQKSQINFVSAEKILKSRRKSFTDNTLDRITGVPKPSVVTKIKSKNGKSLKLIRKIVDTSLPSTSTQKMKIQNIVNNRKMELKQQASRVAMCLINNRLKKNRFSKINVPVKEPQSLNYNKNIYKKNNVPRKPLTKSALVGKKELAAIVTKTQIRNALLDRTKFIKSKYCLIRKQSSNIISRYKLSKTVMKRITPHEKLVQRKKLKWKRKIDTPRRRLTRKDLSIKKIGGVFYRYSRTTLTKNRPSCKQVPQLQSKGINHVLPQRRQNHFCLDKSWGKKRVSGVSFVTSPSGMSWRRRNHSSPRSILTQATQKSIFMLSKKMKKNNEPCLFHHRYGQCSGYERGTCVRLHDSKYVAVCKKFIQGLCVDNQCRLNHQPSSHNLPTCQHFLAGQCGRDNCPYPHIKVSDSAPICLDFLKGYCSLGDQCAKRHIEMCPSFEKGICARGKYCPYPHPKIKTGESLRGKFKHIKRKPQPPKEAELVSTPNLRYFEDINLQKEYQIHLCEEQEESGNDDSEEAEEVACLKTRPALGELPSFIPLSSSFQEHTEDT